MYMAPKTQSTKGVKPTSPHHPVLHARMPSCSAHTPLPLNPPSLLPPTSRASWRCPAVPPSTQQHPTFTAVQCTPGRLLAQRGPGWLKLWCEAASGSTNSSSSSSTISQTSKHCADKRADQMSTLVCLLLLTGPDNRPSPTQLLTAANWPTRLAVSLHTKTCAAQPPKGAAKAYTHTHKTTHEHSKPSGCSKTMHNHLSSN